MYNRKCLARRLAGRMFGQAAFLINAVGPLALILGSWYDELN
ncbi:hypothetical protein P4K96_04105 [Bacillus cereus]|nr:MULTISPECIES: hypothetical protein [Paenibacillus]MEB9892777.1 hypothetical protein [Bacillus cereus]